MQTEVRERTLWIDVLKGMAIILVVVGHNSNDSIKEFIYCFHMPLFFLLSGFIFSPKPIKQYLTKSFRRLVIPYIAFWVTISIPQIILFLSDENAFDNCKYLIKAILYGGTLLTGVYGVFWFVPVLWVASNLFNYILAKHNREWLLLILVLIGYFLSHIPYPMPWNIHVVPMAISYIWIGWLLKKYLDRGGVKRLKFILSAVLILVAIYLLRRELTMDMKYAKYGIFCISMLSSILSSLSICILAIILSSNNNYVKILGYIGGASMVIMYVHLPVKYWIVGNIFHKNQEFWGILIGIVLSIIVYMVLSKTRITNKLYLGVY